MHVHKIWAHCLHDKEMRALYLAFNSTTDSQNQMQLEMHSESIVNNKNNKIEFDPNRDHVPLSRGQVPLNFDQVPLNRDYDPLNRNQVPLSRDHVPLNRDQVPLNL